MERGNKLALVSLALAPLLLSVEAQGAISGATCSGNTSTNITNQQVRVIGNEAARTININTTPGGTDVHSVFGASIGLNGAILGRINVGQNVTKTNRNILWLNDSTLTTFTNNGTITGSSGVWMQNST
ncbi:hypothetical protein, partial [uncultured Helicobacter sp.]